MRALIVFYSRTGTTKLIANKLLASLICESEEIFDEKNRSGPLGWLGGGRDASNKVLTKIKTTKLNPANFDIVILGSPVWVGNAAPALRTYIFENKAKLKKVAFFCTLGGKDSSQFFRDVEEICGQKPVATLAISTRDAKNSDSDTKVSVFVKNIK